MPHAHAAAVVDRLLRRLASNARPLELPPNIEDDLTHVSRTLARMQDVLVSLEMHTETQEWMGVIKQVAYDVEDLLDDFEDHSSIESQMSGCIAEATPFCRSCSFLLHISGANRMKEIRRKLDFSAKDSVMFSLIHHPYPDVVKFDNGIVDRSVIIGRENDKAKIKDMLLQSNAEKLSVLPIVGLAGLGKTTLARLIFLDHAEGWNFDLRIWICINRKLDLKKVASDIISQCNHTEENLLDAHTHIIEIQDNLQYLKNCLQDILREKSCLIVLDDLSSTDKNLLDELKEMLKGTNEHTKVLVTTSSEITAELVHTIPPYKLQPLSEDDCWTIFSQKAFGNWNNNNADLKEIGKQIAKRCEGIPSLSLFLGSFLQNHTTNVWLAAKDEELWKLERRLGTKIDVFSPLYRIYYDLPLTVKLCFLYLSIFPKGSIIYKEKLIQQWIALEMIGSKHDSLPTYVHGDMCIQDLLSAQFLRVQNMHSVDGMDNSLVPTALYMHNFVHEFARHVSCDDTIILDGSEMQKGNTKRRTFQYALLTCYGGQLTFSHSLLTRTRALHLRSSEAITFHKDVFESLKHLRVLDLSRCCIRELPASIGQLKHLKYLDVSGVQIQTLPSSMNRLTNLEVLDLSSTSLKEIPSFVCTFLDLKYLNMQGCDRLQNLPSTLNHLKKLVHLQLSCCNSIVELPDSICNLHDLQYLDLSRCIELQHLPPLFGSLKNLENLSLFSCFSLKQLPESFGNLYFLRFLNLSGCYELQKLPESLTGLKKLEVLMLQRCCRLQDLPPSFVTIKDLRVLNLAGCEELRVSTEMLPTNLEYLNLQRCLKLQTQPYCFDNFSKLKFLNLSQCLHTVDCLKSVSYLSNLEHLNMSENFLDIPVSFARLQKLHTLDLTGCPPIHQFSSEDQILAVADIISKMTALRFVLTKDPLLVASLPRHILCSVGIGEHWHVTTDELVITDITRGSKGLSIAERLNLLNRPELRFLKLEWLLKSHSDGDDLVCYVEEDEVLEKLQPNNNLECFEVVKYAGHAFPTWMMNNMITSFPYLVRICLFHLQNCDDLPPLGQLINLRYLHIKDMPNLRNLEMGLSGGSQPFKKLTQLKLETLINLEELSILFLTEDGNPEFMFPTLEELSVLSCFKLTFKPSLPRCMRYEIRDSKNMLCGQPLGPSSSPSPVNIEISGCVVPSSWFQWLKSLKTLKNVVFDACVGDDGAELTYFELPETNGTQESSNTNILDETTNKNSSGTNISHEFTTQDGAPKHTGSGSSIIRKLLRKFNTTSAHAEESHALAVQEKHYEKDSGKMLTHLVRSKSNDADNLSQCSSAYQYGKAWSSYSGVEDSAGNSTWSSYSGVEDRSQYSQYATVSASPLVGLPEFSNLGWGHWFTLRDLELATNRFSRENVIGEGRYGIVYRGRLINGTAVAIKKLLNFGQEEKEFRVEVEAIGHVRHKNLVRLLGYSIEGIHRMLVYEYVNNGNLEQWLHGAMSIHGVLSWVVRMKVLLGVAKALAYLHEAIEPKVVHRDIKPSNILIDEEFNGKLSDFGLAKFLGAGKSHITTRVMGSFGYVAPEYAQTGLLNEKSDIYSFGVLLLEAVTGRDPVNYARPANEVNIVEWLKRMVAMRRSEEVADPAMELKPTPRALKRTLLTVLRCVDPNAERRPNMGQVVRMLEARDGVN